MESGVFGEHEIVRVAMAGSRSFGDYELFRKDADLILKVFKKMQVVSGGAKGTDGLASRWCEERGVEIEEKIPNYEAHSDKIAPLLRNTQIVDAVDCGVVWWDGVSKGSLNVIVKFAKAKKPCLILSTKT